MSSRTAQPSRLVEPVAIDVLDAFPGVDADRDADGLARQPRVEQPRVGGPRRAAAASTGAGSASRTRTRSVIGPRLALVEPGVVEAGHERAGESQLVVPGQARRRDVGAGRQRAGAARASARRGVSRDRPVQRERRSGRSSRSAAASSAGRRAGFATAPLGVGRRRHPTNARSAVRRTSAAIAAGSPSTPVASAMAARKPANRRSSSSSCAPVATPSMTATVSPSAKTARSGPWIGSSWSSRMASSSDGTPGPAEPRGEPRPLAGDAVPDLAELPEDVACRRPRARPSSPRSQMLAARADVLETGPRVAEGHEGAGVVGQAEALRQRPPDLALRAVGRLDARRAPTRRIRPLVVANRVW